MNINIEKDMEMERGIMEYNEKMQNDTDRHGEYMEMRNMYEEGLLEG